MSLTHLIFDTETLGKREDCVILSIACVPFTFEDGGTFLGYVKSGIKIKFNVKEQIKDYKRTLCQDTVEWWKKQSKEAKEMNLTPSFDDMSLVDGLKTLSKFIGQTPYQYGNSYVFSRGTYFDFPKLEHIYEVSGNMKVPFNTYKIRDVRTYIDIMAGVNTGQYDTRLANSNSFIKHDCLHDAAMDATRMNELYQIALIDEDIPF